MATANHNPPETKTVEVKPESFDLHLSREEAEALVALVGACSFADDPTHRVFRALRGAGADPKAFRVAHYTGKAIRVVKDMGSETF